jgi:hypothetical protein
MSHTIPSELADLQFADSRAERIMEELRIRLANAGFGVTVIGPHLTVRFGGGASKRLVCVSMQVTSITDSTQRERVEDEEDGQ